MKEIQNNIYIRHPVSLEQYLMEGSYNKIFLSKNNVPSKYYTFFIDRLLDTIREDIGKCLEKAYTRISSVEAARLLFYEPGDSGLTQYAQKNGWKLNDKQEFTFNTNQSALAGEVRVPAKKLSLRMLDYARELEMIV